MAAFSVAGGGLGERPAALEKIQLTACGGAQLGSRTECCSHSPPCARKTATEPPDDQRVEFAVPWWTWMRFSRVTGNDCRGVRTCLGRWTDLGGCPCGRCVVSGETWRRA